MDSKLVGIQIANLRKAQGLTQNNLGDRLGVTFQAASKWGGAKRFPTQPF